MFSLIRSLFRGARSGTRAGAQRGPVRRRLECETLEDRTLLSLTTGDVLLNSTRPRVQKEAVVAHAPDGRSVVVWTEVKSSTDSDIKAQRFNRYGRKVGREITVASGREKQYDPDVAVDARGNFVVVWTIDFTRTDKDIHGARFSASGSRLGREFRVAWYYKSEYDPSIAMASNGNFVVSYTYQFNRRDTDVHARRFRASGSLVRTINVAVSRRKEFNSDTTAARDGRFAVAYTYANDVYLQRFTASGRRIDKHRITTNSRAQTHPSVDMDNHGNSVVAYQEFDGRDWNLHARRVSNRGALSSVITVQAGSTQDTLPSVAVDPRGRRFVTAYQVSAGRFATVKVSEFTTAGRFLRTSTVGRNLSLPDVSIATDLRFLVVSQSTGRRGADRDGGVFGRFGRV